MKPSTKILLMQKRLLTPIFLGSKLALWLDAADIRTIILNDSTVSEWKDKSGNNRNFLQANTVSQPRYNATELNGKPTLMFDGENDFLASAGWNGLISGLSGLAVFCVIKGTSGALINTSLNNGIQLSIESSGDFWINSSTRVKIPFTANFDIQNYIFNAGTREVYRNGNLLQTATATPNTINTANDSLIEIGRRLWSPQFLLANVAEVLLIRGALSTIEREQLTGYFAHKWKLTANLPNNHPFKFRSPYM